MIRAQRHLSGCGDVTCRCVCGGGGRLRERSSFKGGGLQNGGRGVKFYPYKMGRGGTVLAILKGGGGKKCLGSFNTGA